MLYQSPPLQSALKCLPFTGSHPGPLLECRRAPHSPTFSLLITVLLKGTLNLLPVTNLSLLTSARFLAIRPLSFSEVSHDVLLVAQSCGLFSSSTLPDFLVVLGVQLHRPGEHSLNPVPSPPFRITFAAMVLNNHVFWGQLWVLFSQGPVRPSSILPTSVFFPLIPFVLGYCHLPSLK